MSISVARRRREIGVRMALGARRESVLGDVLFDGLRLAAVGLGLLVAAGLERVLEGHLFGIEAGHLPTRIGACLVLPAAVIGACCRPASRASAVDPAVTLRHE